MSSSTSSLPPMMGRTARMVERKTGLRLKKVAPAASVGRSEGTAALPRVQRSAVANTRGKGAALGHIKHDTIRGQRMSGRERVPSRVPSKDTKIPVRRGRFGLN